MSGLSATGEHDLGSTYVRVLFLEDDPGVAMWAKPAFSFLAGIDDVEVVTDDFRRLFDEDRWKNIDAFVTDWMVPNFNVSELLEWVRERFPQIRTVVYTAAPVDAVDHGGFADRVIQKGEPFETLVEAIRA